jgi:hypothetical protein
LPHLVVVDQRQWLHSLCVSSVIIFRAAIS